MSHIASLTSVLLLTVAIVLAIVGLTQPWGEGTAGSDYETTLWDIEVALGDGSKTTMSWDDVCALPTIDDEVKSGCDRIKACRVLLIIACLFSFFAATGNAAGIYTGNTLIDAAAGVVAGFSCFFTALGLGLAFWTFPADALTSSPGWNMTSITMGLQFIGSICGCVGTCQEMHEMSVLARSLNLGAYKEKEAAKARSEKCAVLREAEDSQAREIYDNLQKRKRKEEEKARKLADPMTVVDVDDEETGGAKKVPVMLQRVLFRKPQEGDDDEIPTRMLEDAFAEIDGDGSGSIELDELVDALKLCGLAVSKNATDIVMKEIDKNASGDVDLREFIEFFRHIEDLNRFQKKTAARQQFLSFLLNFCFLADIVVVGVMLMMFIRMDKDENPDNYSIMRNVLMACSFVLGILFLAVILMPILRLALGPTANRMQLQYELAQEIKKSQRKKMQEEDNSNDTEAAGPRQAGYTAEDPPPPVNAAMFGRSYRPGKLESTAWAPAIEDLPPLHSKDGLSSAQGGKSTTSDGRATTAGSHGSGNRAATNMSHATQASHGSTGSAKGRAQGDVKNVKRPGNFRYDPSNYSIAANHATMMDAAGLGPTSWTPMQVKDANVPKQTGPPTLPGVPLALTDAAVPSSMR